MAGELALGLPSLLLGGSLCCECMQQEVFIPLCPAPHQSPTERVASYAGDLVGQGEGLGREGGREVVANC